MPVGKPAPPRPRSPDFLTSSVTCSGVIPPPTTLFRSAVAAVGDIAVDGARIVFADARGGGRVPRQASPKPSRSVELLLVHRLVVLVVDHHRGGAVAARDAFDLDHGEPPSSRRFLETDTERCLQCSMRSRARRDGTKWTSDLEQVLPDGMEVVHRVESEHAVDVRGRQLQDPRDFLGGLPGDPAPGLLGDPEYGRNAACFVGTA